MILAVSRWGFCEPVHTVFNSSPRHAGRWVVVPSADFEVIEAADGEAGLAVAATHRPDLILMDIQLPRLDGYEATRRIKADAVLRAIPVIAVTSYGLAGDDDKARAAGCDGYISKPYSPRQLLAKVHEYLVAPTR
jgi:two-component system, cell cycle response regulator DivK